MEKWKEESRQNNNFRSHMSLGKKKKVPDLSLCEPAQRPTPAKSYFTTYARHPIEQSRRAADTRSDYIIFTLRERLRPWISHFSSPVVGGPEHHDCMSWPRQIHQIHWPPHRQRPPLCLQPNLLPISLRSLDPLRSRQRPSRAHQGKIARAPT